MNATAPPDQPPRPVTKQALRTAIALLAAEHHGIPVTPNLLGDVTADEALTAVVVIANGLLDELAGSERITHALQVFGETFAEER